MPWNVTSFYKFHPIANLPEAKSRLKTYMTDRQVVGLLVLANEGINGTVAAQSDLSDFKRVIESLTGSTRFKDSSCDRQPFQRVSVDIRDEIVGMKQPETVPDQQENHHLTPSEWHARLAEKPIVIDTRNTYETNSGKFKNAIDPRIQHFSEWPTYLDQADLPKHKEILIYCTGGIRCEKAILAMHERGYDNVYQLRDGILGYLAEYPDAEYEGECFVFDERVTVGQDLKPTGNFGICPGCGLTSNIKTNCDHCHADFFTCEACDWSLCGKKCRSEAEGQSRKTMRS